jgi:hypothetical protein
MPNTPSARSLVEIVARALYLKSLQRDAWHIDDADERWETAKARFAENPDFYKRPGHAFEDAKIAVRAVLDAIAEPSDATLAAAVALPITKYVDGMIGVTAMRYGGDTGLPMPPNSPIQQWYRAIIETLRKEIENG